MKTILVTGASRGIGLEWTRQCLERGHRLLATCRDPDDAEALSLLQDNHCELLSVLTFPSSAAAMILDIFFVTEYFLFWQKMILFFVQESCSLFFPLGCCKYANTVEDILK